MRGSTVWEDELGTANPVATERLKLVASGQRWVIAVVLAQLALWVGWLLLALARKVNGDPEPAFVLSFLLGLVGAVCVFRLAHAVRGPGAAYLYGLAAVVPVLGLIVTLLINGYASDELKAHGIVPGFFGASDGTIEARTAADEWECRFEDEGW